MPSAAFYSLPSTPVEIAELTQAASNVSNSSSQVNLNAEQLAKLATMLDGTVGKFKV